MNITPRRVNFPGNSLRKNCVQVVEEMRIEGRSEDEEREKERRGGEMRSGKVLRLSCIIHARDAIKKSTQSTSCAAETGAGACHTFHYRKETCFMGKKTMSERQTFK